MHDALRYYNFGKVDATVQIFVCFSISIFNKLEIIYDIIDIKFPNR